MKRRSADGDEQLQEHRALGVVVVETRSASVMVRRGVPGEVGVDRLTPVVVIRLMTTQMGVNERRAECGGLDGNGQANRDQSPQHKGIIGSC